MNETINFVNNCLLDTSYNFTLVLFGAIIGLMASLVVFYVQRDYDNKAKEEYGERLIDACMIEISEGIKRCKRLIQLKMEEESKVSFSRIYTACWNSSINQIAETIKDENILRKLHQIYSRFDLINFNMNRNRFGVGASFAEDHIDKIMKDYKKLKNLIKNK